MSKRTGTVEIDWSREDGHGTFCHCGLPVVLRYESKGTVHYDFPHDVDLPNRCADAATWCADTHTNGA